MVNKVILVGNVGKDPEVRHLESGIAVATLLIATSETYKKDGQRVTNTEWHNVVFWRGLAQVIEEYVKKGDMLYIEGRIRTRSWEDKEGIKRYATEVLADNMKMLGARKNTDTSQQQNNTSNNTTSQTQNTTVQENKPDFDNDLEPQDDDLPF